MRLAVLLPIKKDWNEAPEWLAELKGLLARTAGIDASVWLLDDGASSRPPSWHALDPGAAELHVLELQGRQGRNRAFAAALGHLLFEREESFDAFLLLDASRPRELRHLDPLFEAHFHRPGAAVFVPAGPRRIGPGRRARRLAARLLSGETLTQSPALLLPANIAEALCHSSYGASHVESAIRRLGFESAWAVMPARSAEFDAIAAASVFRDRVFARVWRGSAALSLLSLATAAACLLARLFGAGPAGMGAAAAALALAAVALGMLSVFAILLGIFSQSLNEAPRWTPALDSALLIRAVTRVRREPYAIPAAR